MLRCHDVTRLVASDGLAALGPGVRFRVWLHARMCRHCRRYGRQIRAIGEMARRLAYEDEAGVTFAPLAARIRAALTDIRPSTTEETP